MHVVTYTRVSTEEQHAPNKVSISEQAESIRAYVAAHGWTIVAEYSDTANYIATARPDKGTLVNPSGSRVDRPGFVAMLAHVLTGQVDGIVCHLDDRLYRHERVVTALKDTLEDADRIRSTPVEIHQAKGGGKIDREFMYLQGMIWRMENQRRAQRSVDGKAGTLKMGFWPGAYKRLGYKTIKAIRGNEIIIDESAASTVRQIFDWYDAGRRLIDISRLLIAAGHHQPPGAKPRRVDWSVSVLYTILTARDYTGAATWHFKTGSISIDIPAIIDPEQFERVQARLRSSNAFSPRRAKHHFYLLAGIGYCGFCGRRLIGKTELVFYRRLVDGTPVTYHHHKPRIYYYCPGRARSGGSDCPGLRINDALEFEWQVWRVVVDRIINNDDLLTRLAERSREQQRVAGSDHDANLAELRRYLAGLEQRRQATRSRYARGGLSETDLDAILAEIDLATLETQAEIAKLAAAAEAGKLAAAGLATAAAKIATWRVAAGRIDIPPGEMAELPEDERAAIYRDRQAIVRGACRRVDVRAADDFAVAAVIGGVEL